MGITIRQQKVSKLVEDFIPYIVDIFTNEPSGVLPSKLRAILERLQDSTVREISSTMLGVDVDCSEWSDDILAEKMLRHVKFRGSPGQMLPAHCMMLEAGKRLKRK